jgi:D-lactate dehydrogenase
MAHITFYSSQNHDRASFEAANARMGHSLQWTEHRLDAGTAALAAGSEVVCAFVNDDLQADTLAALRDQGVRLIALRSAGFNHVDMEVARGLGLQVVRVPAYSPHAVAEHAMGLVLSLNRKLHRAYARVREGNFSLQGLTGFDLHGRTVGVVGAGQIGLCFARIAAGFGCRVLLHDPAPSAQALASGFALVTLDELWQQSHVVSLHCPLTPQTRHLVNGDTLTRMRRGVMIINTGRGALLDTRAVILALKRGHVGYLGLDVYEEEEGLFFEDHSDEIIQDDVFMRLLTFPNVMITAHQAFLTEEALSNIAQTTLENVRAWEQGDTHAMHLVPTPGADGTP